MITDPDYLQKKNVILIRALIVSGAINLIVLSLLSYWMIRERPPSPYCELKPKKNESIPIVVNPAQWSDKLAEVYTLSFNQLTDRLTGNQLIGNAYREKDIALACLIDAHYFDIHRALTPKNLPPERHLIKWNKDPATTIQLTLYPDLKKSDFNAIILFAKNERWPLTTEGLFLNLQKQIKIGEVDSMLIETLALSSEFWSMEPLLNRGDCALSKPEIAALIAEGNWKLLSEFVKQQRENHDLSDERRRKVLLEYVNVNSSLAAELLIASDSDYVLKKLDDDQVLSLLKLLSKKTRKNELFAKELLMSPRSDRVWQSAASLLYNFAGEKKPETWNYDNIISRFIRSPIPITKKFPPFSTVQPITKSGSGSGSGLNTVIIEKVNEKVNKEAEKKFILYSVQKGDSLWKISRKFNVEMEVIRKANQLKSDSIKTGIVLKIPT